MSTAQQAQATTLTDEKEKEKEKLKQEEKAKEENKTGDLRRESDPVGYDRSFAQNFYGEAQSDYLRYLGPFREKTELIVRYQAAEETGTTPEEKKESLLFSKVIFKDVKLKPCNYTALQYDHVLNLKSKMDDFLRRQTIPMRELFDRGEKLPEGWDTLLQDKARTESEYYRDAARIFYNMEIDGNTQPISKLEADSLDRTNRKVAVDVAFLKSETGPKKSET